MTQKLPNNFICIFATSVLLLAVGITAQQPNDLSSQKVTTKMLEIEKAANKALSKAYGDLLSSISTVPARYDWNSWSPKYRLLVVNYGSDQRIERREKLFLKELERFRLYHARITIVRGGICKSERTVFWQILFEPGVSNPEICGTQ